MKLYDETMMTETPKVDPTEPKVEPTVPAAPAVQPASVQPASAQPTAAQPNAGYNPPDYTGQINDIYDKYLAAQRAQLDSGYEANMRELEAAAAKIPGLYQQRGNDLNAQYERNRAALNEQMAANGLNVGAGSQARLAQNTGYLNAYGQIQAAQADAQAAIEQQKAAREAEYQAAITQALRDNDYQRAVALTQEMKDQRNADLDRAKLLAGYGDFSGYAQLYGDDTAKNMRDVWMAQNPQYAYMTGNLTADQYYRLTGKMPNGTQPTPVYTPPVGDDNTPDDDREIPVPPGATPTNRLMYDLGQARNEQEFVNIANQLNAQGNLTAQQQQAIMDRYARLYGKGK